MPDRSSRPRARYFGAALVVLASLGIAEAAPPAGRPVFIHVEGFAPTSVGLNGFVGAGDFTEGAAALLERLASGTSLERLAAETRALDMELRREPQVSHRIANFLRGDETLTPQFPGLLRYLAWTAMARFLRPVVNAFDGWRDEVLWLRRYCPTCGSLPAMAQLVGVDPGRMRLLSCGCCGTRWQFKRTGCPFCEADSQRLASVTLEGEPGLRIDHCESCGGYLKTYDGQGNETLLLSDWSSLHLDVIAHDRGLKRLAASLYEFEPVQHPESGGFIPS